ncbi:MAG: hypothetical protein HOE90_24100 [Bacteriovoracaceae bacterium]|nr:hypothetical protein [Bacteriovoracaceae bacterium]
MKSITKFYLTLVLALGMIIPAAFAGKALPEVPDDCFDSNSFCTKRAVLRNAAGKRYINVQFFAAISEDDFDTPEDIVDMYFDFAEWGEYTKGTNEVKMKVTLPMGTYTKDGTVITRHYATYKTKAPFPIGKVHIREVTDYIPLTAYDGAELSYYYTLADASTPIKVPGHGVYKKPEGLKMKNGHIHVAYDEDNGEYILFLNANVIPGIDLLPKIAAPYIERSIVAVAKGMLGL